MVAPGQRAEQKSPVFGNHSGVRLPRVVSWAGNAPPIRSESQTDQRASAGVI